MPRPHLALPLLALAAAPLAAAAQPRAGVLRVEPGAPVDAGVFVAGEVRTVTVTAAPGQAPVVAAAPAGTPGFVALLAAAGEGTLRGRGLAATTGVTVDGRDATFSVVGDTLVRFAVPRLRDCETDGRRVAVGAATAAGRVWAVAAVPAPGAMRLGVGESRVLGDAELACLTLPRGDEHYVLSAVNFSPAARRARWATADTLFTLHVLADAAAVAARTRAIVAVPPGAAAAAPGDDAAPDRAGARRALADAGVGDTVELVDWGAFRAADACALDTAGLPRVQAVVAAVSGAAVVLRDTRLAAAPWTTPAVRGRLARAAAAVDRALLPALHEVLSPAYAMPAAAGGRHATLLTRLPAGVAGIATPVAALDPAACAPAMGVSLVRVSEGAHAWPAGQFAGVAIHEHAHVADFLLGGGLAVAAAGGGGEAWLGEALAASVEEAASRHTSGQRRAARRDRLGDDDPRPTWTDWADPRAARWATWGRLGDGDAGAGQYVTGAQLVLFARERLAAATAIGAAADSLPRTLYERLGRGPTRSLDGIAAAVGTTADALLDDLVLALVTDDLVPADSARARGLPQVDGWDNAPASLDALYERLAAVGPAHLVQRHAPRAQPVVVASGGYDFWYVPGDAERGVSLAFAARPRGPAADDAAPPAGPAPAPGWRVRVTRIR